MREASRGGLGISLPLPLIVAVLAVSLAACAGPAKREYVLGSPAVPSGSVLSVQAASPVVQVERVQVPDYLDTRDIVTRHDRQVVPSETGRWAERLSVGATRALAAALAAQLKGVAVTSSQPIDPPAVRVVVDIVDFDASLDGSVVLAARWTVTDATGQRSLSTEQATVSEPVSSERDAALVAAMSAALDKLAIRISAGIEPNLAQRPKPLRSNLPSGSSSL